MRIFLLVEVLIFTLIINAFSQSEFDTTKSAFIPNVKPELNIPKLDGSKIKVDGKIDEKVWDSAAVARNFTEISPGDNVKPEVETVAKIFYDDDNIYFGYICYEKDMSSVR